MLIRGEEQYDAEMAVAERWAYMRLEADNLASDEHERWKTETYRQWVADARKARRRIVSLENRCKVGGGKGGHSNGDDNDVVDAHHAGGQSGASLPSRGHGGVEYVEAGGAKENSGASWPAAPGSAAAATNEEALFLNYCSTLSTLGDVQLALKNRGVHCPELTEFPKQSGTIFRMGKALQRNRGVASAWNTQAQRATLIFSVV